MRLLNGWLYSCVVSTILLMPYWSANVRDQTYTNLRLYVYCMAIAKKVITGNRAVVKPAGTY
jgi:hypothetical protein